jgi:cytochrome c-type biogenesis protein
VGPILGGVLTYVASQERTLSEGVLLLGTFSSAIVLPLLGVAIGTDYFLPQLRKLNRFTPRIEMLAGYGLIVFSVVMLKDAYLSWPSAQSAPALTAQSESTQPGAVPTQMLFFYTDSCPVCYRMKNFLPDFAEECTSDAFRLVPIDLGDASNAQLAAQFNVRAVPTISVLDPKGEEVLHLVGYQSKVALRQAAEAITARTCSDS